MHTRYYGLQLLPPAQSRSSPLIHHQRLVRDSKGTPLLFMLMLLPLADDASLYIPRGSLTESRPPAGRARARRALQTRHHYLWTPRTLELVGRTGSLPSAAEAVVSRGGDPQGAKEARSTIQQAPQMVSAMGHGLRRARSDCSKRRPVPKAG